MGWRIGGYVRQTTTPSMVWPVRLLSILLDV
jgi:hypothetical protein